MTNPAEKIRQKAAAGPQKSVGGVGAPATPSAPQLADPQIAALSQLLRLEAEARQAPSEQALLHLIANEMRGLVRARQAFVMCRDATHAFRVRTVSSLSTVDRNAPVMQWIERLVRELAKVEKTSKHVEFVLPAYADKGDGLTSSYPFQFMLWVPLWSRAGGGSDGVLLARETPWQESDQRIALRLAETCGHALQLLRSRPSRLRLRVPVRKSALIATAVLLAMGLLPVSMTALAPLEVMPRDPHLVTMPVEGIIQQVLVEPNINVTVGQPLVRLVDTVPRNKLELAEREVLVAAAKLEKASSLSFSDARGRHELGIARAELALRQAERDYARSLLAKTIITAAKAGVAVFADRKELEGKPLPVGEKVMLIADPAAVELKIDLPVAESVVLVTGARAKAFLDSDPLHPIEAKVARIDYQAKLSETSIASYRLMATLDASDRPVPQMGVRGTVQLYGPQAPLAVFLLRRPLSALRQWAGL